MMHHWRCANASLNADRVAAVSERALTVEPGERAVLAVGRDQAEAGEHGLALRRGAERRSGG